MVALTAAGTLGIIPLTRTAIRSDLSLNAGQFISFFCFRITAVHPQTLSGRLRGQAVAVQEVHNMVQVLQTLQALAGAPVVRQAELQSAEFSRSQAVAEVFLSLFLALRRPLQVCQFRLPQSRVPLFPR